MWPDFDSSMANSFKYNHERQCDAEWDVLRNRYEQINNNKTNSKSIPKIIHQIWLGSSMPDSEKRMSAAIKDSLDSTWEYRFWSDSDVASLNNFKNYDLFLSSPNMGQKSDLLRYAILKEYGGIYLDTDFLPFGSFENLLGFDFFCGIAYDNVPNIFNGLIGSTKDNAIINDLQDLDTELVYNDAMALMNCTGPFFLTRKFFKNIYKEPRAVALPNSFFYPYPNFDFCKSQGNNFRNYIKPETICCHMWSSSWM